MKIPKKVTICGKTYRVVYDRSKHSGWGRGNTSTKEITLGDSRNKEAQYESFLHEVVELILLENNVRFNRNTNDDFIYLITHTELERIVVDLSLALKPLVEEKNNRGKLRKKRKR